MLTVIRQGATGEKSGRSEGPYTGEIWRDIVHQDPEISVGSVYFTPCARSYWHTHPGGQLLIVVSGEGVVADADGVVHMTVGDMVWTPPDVRHWHGATAERSVLNTVITYRGVEWQEEVSESDYQAAVGQFTSTTASA
jgi:quercetin dioxygenase-like cupin family protein